MDNVMNGLHTNTVRVSARVAKMFRKQFYMGKKSPIIKPIYYSNRNKYWIDVLEFFKENDLQWTQPQYFMLAGWDMRITQILLWNGRMCEEKHFRIVKNDVAIMTRDKYNDEVETKIYHIMSKFSYFLGFQEHISVRGCFVKSVDEGYLSQNVKVEISDKDALTESLTDRFIERVFNLKTSLS